MTCKCSSLAEHAARAATSSNYYKDMEIKSLKDKLEELNYDITSYTIKEVEQVGSFLVLMVFYCHPNGKAQKGCTFEGNKVIVFKDVSIKDALKWKVIDPHFRLNDKIKGVHVAPPPIARFPGNTEGWEDALCYVKSKQGKLS